MVDSLKIAWAISREISADWRAITAGPVHSESKIREGSCKRKIRNLLEMILV
jgi:hypothetical protein